MSLEADLLPRSILLPLEDPLGSTVKKTQDYSTEQGEDAESKTYTDSKIQKIHKNGMALVFNDHTGVATIGPRGCRKGEGRIYSPMSSTTPSR